MFAYAQVKTVTIKDDQQVFVRYMLENPDMASIDVENTFFMTGFKEYDRYSLLYTIMHCTLYIKIP